MSPTSHSRNYRGKTLAVLATVAVVSGGALGYRAVTGGGGESGGPNWAGPFNCYGVQSLPSSCYSLNQTCDYSPANNTDLGTAITNATGGQVICLDANTTFTAGTITADKSSNVTIQPAAGRTPTLSFGMSGADHWDIKGLTIQGGTTVAGSTNILLDHDTWIEHVAGLRLCNNTSCQQAGGPANANVLVDYDNFTKVADAGCSARLCFDGQDPSGPSGWQVSHSLFSGIYSDTDCSDGINPRGFGNAGASDVMIGPGNEFTGIIEDGCNIVNHADPVAWQGCVACTVTGNYFHDNGDGSGGIWVTDLNTRVTNNVVVNDYPGGAYGCAAERHGNGGYWLHNYIGSQHTGSGRCTFTDGGGGGCDNVGTIDMRNNVWTPNSEDFQCSAGATYINGYGLNNTQSGTGNRTENPVKTVSSPTTGYYSYALDPSSTGYNTASDGKPMGICATCG